MSLTKSHPLPLQTNPKNDSKPSQTLPKHFPKKIRKDNCSRSNAVCCGMLKVTLNMTHFKAKDAFSSPPRRLQEAQGGSKKASKKVLGEDFNQKTTIHASQFIVAFNNDSQRRRSKFQPFPNPNLYHKETSIEQKQSDPVPQLIVRSCHVA